MRKKRGVSPLIASVLLIAFTIMLFVLISTWVRKSVVEPGMGEAGEKLGSALECMNTKIEIVNICQSSNKLKIDIDNIGDTTLIGIGVRANGDKGTSALEEISGETAPYGRLSKTSANDYNSYGDFSKMSVEVYPKTKTGICRDAMDTKTGIAACLPTT